ncbi:MAG TPA: LapA family protein [Gaiellaceae bacterium]|nr:LapA family protein [Gaiellaceae bacterium]
MADEPAKRERPPWIQLAAIGLIGLYALLFIILNTHRAKVSFVFGTTRVSVIWVILLSLAVGFVLGVLGSRLHRRRKRRG